MEVSSGIPTTGISALIARVVTARPRGGRVSILTAMAPGSTPSVALLPRAVIRPVGIAASPRRGSARMPAPPLAPHATTPIPSPGPLSWNPARRKPRAIWRVGFAGASAAGLSASSRIITGQPTTAADLSRRCGRVWMPGVAGPQPPLLQAMRPVAAWSRWRAGRSASLGLPPVVAPPPLNFIVTARPSHRACRGFASALRFSAGIAPPQFLPGRATLTPTAREGNPPRPGGRAWISEYPSWVPQPLVWPGAVVASRRGDDKARRRPGWLLRFRPVGLAFGGRLHYNIYTNSGTGDPVDYSIPIAALMSTTWTSSGLAVPGSWSFAIRAADGNGEEQNLDCAVTIVLDGSGNDITNRPAPPGGLRAFATASGGIRVEWYYPPTRGAKAPAGFNVYLGKGGRRTTRRRPRQSRTRPASSTRSSRTSPA